MFYKETISVVLSFDKKVSYTFFNKKIGFTLVPRSQYGEYEFHVDKIIGKFEICAIAHDEKFTQIIPFNKKSCTFKYHKASATTQIWISINVEMKKVNYEQVWYQLKFSSIDMKMMEIFDYYERTLVMPGYDYIKFNCFIKKVAEGKIEIEIENPFDIRIQGKRGNYIYTTKETEDVNLSLSIIFQPKEHMHLTEKVDSRPDSALPIEIATNVAEILTAHPNQISHPILSEITIVSSDDIDIPADQSLLKECSRIFDKILKNLHPPMKICIDNYDADTISTALEFLQGKHKAIKGKEEKVLYFAKEYEIEKLMEACVFHFEETMDVANVCEYIQLAYRCGDQTFKKASKNFLVDNKNFVDKMKFKKLSQEIIFDVFCM